MTAIPYPAKTWHQQVTVSGSPNLSQFEFGLSDASAVSLNDCDSEKTFNIGNDQLDGRDSKQQDGRRSVVDEKEETSSQTSESTVNDVEASPTGVSPKFNLHGWRFALTIVALCLGSFLTILETMIVSTSIVSITNDLGGLQQSSWIVNAYLVTYTAVLVVAAKLSDTFGRKVMFVSGTTLFTAFSLACGLAQTFIQLIVFRAFQGLGAGIMYSLVYVVLAEIAPPKTYAVWTAVLSVVYVFAAVMGPLWGGLINDHSSWRWIFWLNIPGGCLVLAILLVAMPWSFPLPVSEKFDVRATFSRSSVRKVDWMGAFLLLAANVLFIVAVEEGGTDYTWTSATVLTLLFVALAVWAAFFGWSKWHSTHLKFQESVFPWRICTNRFAVGTILATIFNGGVFFTTLIGLPQRFEVVNGLSPLSAAIRILPLTLCAPFAAAVSAAMTQNLKMPPFYVLVGSSCLSILGAGLATLVDASVGSVPGAIYGFQVLLGLGIGMIANTVVVVVPMMFEERDIPVGVGSVNQARTLGGSLALSVATNVLNSRLKQRLSSTVSSADIQTLMKSAESISTFSVETQMEVRDAFGDGYKLQLWVIFAFSVAGLFATALLWERPLRRVGGSRSSEADSKPKSAS